MATNKLRKRLEEADDQTLSKMTENFCMIGTPLPRLDGKKDANEFKPAWQQEVLDEQGRRRFHGAFTGGFSAGYYNTVGSKEGWAPSTFRSSRKDKERGGDPNTLGSKPEDFMDEEDLESFRQGKGALSSTQTYGMERAHQERDPLMDMLGIGQDQATPRIVSNSDQGNSIHVAPSSLGTKLLQRMGWRQGQGLGPRVSFQRRVELLVQMGKPTIKEESTVEEAQKHLYAPPDTPMPTFSTKNDSKGLGWVGESQGGGLHEALRRAREEERSNNNNNNRTVDKKSGGFGVGALEDESDGEDEVYSSGYRIEESTLDPTWSRDRDRMIIGSGPRRATQTDRTLPIKKDNRSSGNVWHDGRVMIAGFHIATRTVEKEPSLESHPLPTDWKPDPSRVWNKAVNGNANTSSAHSMSAADRASILGEARLPGPPPSILDYLSVKEKERLQRGKEAAAALSSGTIRDPPRTEDDDKHRKNAVPVLDAAIARAALQGYMPFNAEPEKQKRYQAYLSSQAYPSENATAALRPSSNQTQSQFIFELRDFAKSAGIFKPMSNVMASRFQSSISGSNDLPQVRPGLHIPPPKPKISLEEEKAKADEERQEEEDRKRREEMDTLSSFQRNARLGIFGRTTTREVLPWKPARLLCKRFNVPMPYPEEEDQARESDGRPEEALMEDAFGASKMRKMETPKVNAKWEASKRQLQQLASQQIVGRSDSLDRVADSRPGNTTEEKETTVRNSNAVDVNNIGLGEAEDRGEEAEYVKPSMDVFKAVFADDDDDDDDDEEESEQQSQQKKEEVEGRKEAIEGNRRERNEDGDDGQKKMETAPASIDTFKPTFIPRKRPAAEEDSAKKEKGERKKKKEPSKSSRGLLTFSVEDEGAEAHISKAKTAVKTNRVRAADLFN